MSGFAFVFVGLPCLAAALAGALLRDWRLAAAAAAGATGLLFLVVGPITPWLSGLAVGALALVALLLLRPGAEIWTRLLTAVAAAFTVHYALLLTLA